jgi:hypothetical protein
VAAIDPGFPFEAQKNAQQGYGRGSISAFTSISPRRRASRPCVFDALRRAMLIEPPDERQALGWGTMRM